MDDKEKADSYIELCKVQMEHFRQTRDIEFKVNLALWTLIVVAGAFLYTNNARFTASYVLMSLAIIAGHLFFWMMPIQRSEDRDNHYIQQYRKEVEDLAGTAIAKPNEPKHFKWLLKFLENLREDGWSWIIFEVGFTTVLLSCVGLVLFLREPVPASEMPEFIQATSILLTLVGASLLGFSIWRKRAMYREFEEKLGVEEKALLGRRGLILSGLVLIFIAVMLQLWVISL